MTIGRQAALTGSRYLPGGAPREELSDGQLLEAFVRQRDEAAFAALVRRHGPMVLGVCRRVLRNADDAEDAFQATFLVLVHKARSLQQPNLLASWLHGVAYRTAQHARVGAARRHHHEREAASMAQAAADPDTFWHEMRESLDEELQRLPELYRAPLVLCYLEGKTNIEAAQILGWPAGSMSARLTKAREMLRERMTRRHRALPVLLFPGLLSRFVNMGQVPGSLLEMTLRAAHELMAGKALTAGLVSPTVQALTEVALQTLPGQRRWRFALVIALLAALLLGLGTAAYAWSGGWPLNNSTQNATESSGSQNGEGGAPAARCH
jgi:RNA polymerase sigma factor (sigma-70 family)